MKISSIPEVCEQDASTLRVLKSCKTIKPLLEPDIK